MQFDEILKAVGEFGPYQCLIYILICLPCVFVGMHDVNPSFLLYVPYYRCRLPMQQNDTYRIQSPRHAHIINETIPQGKDKSYMYDQCHIYTTRNDSNTTMARCSEWVYDETVFKSTFVTEHNIVCGDNIFEVANMRMMGYIGYTVGGIIVGVLSDCVGRKKIFNSSILVMLITTLSLSWAPNRAGFIALKFLYGISGAGVYSTAFVLGLELVGPNKRVGAAMGISCAYSTGMILLPGIGYWLRNWHIIEIVQSAPIALFLVYFIILPESPRWLISQGRKREAKVIVQMIAKYNKTKSQMPSESEFEDNDGEIPEKSDKIRNLFKSCVLIQRSIIVFFNWFVVGMAYYGLSLNVDNLVGDFYLNFFLTSLVDIPAYIICLFLLDRTGRKTFYVIAIATGGMALICTIFTTLYASDKPHPTLIMSLIGRLGVAAAYAISYIWTAEIFPTGVRHSGIGVSTVCANLGSILSPYIVDLNIVVSGTVGRVIPLVVFGALALTGGFLSLFLPETLKKDLPETIQQAENVGRDKDVSSKRLLVNTSEVETTLL